MKKYTIRYFLLFFCYIGLTAPLLAVDGPAPLKITGKLVNTPKCFINNGEKIVVEFGDNIGINKIDTGEYRQEIISSITCEADYSSAVVLSISGDKASYDADGAAIVTVEQPDLGIKFYRNNTAFPINETQVIDKSALLKLEAVLIQRSGSTLIEGPFTASATLKVQYQ